MVDKNWRSDDPDALMRWAYEIVCKHPGLTAREIGALLGEYGHEVLRRSLSDLKRDGHIIYGERKVCSISGRSVGTWWPKQGRLL